MSALEREIIEKFHQLLPDAQQRVLAAIEQEIAGVEKPKFDFETWVQTVKAIRAEILANQLPGSPPIDAIGMLRDLRDGEDDE